MPAKTTSYVIYRTGSNAYNQPATFEPVPVAVVEGTGTSGYDRRADAKQRAAELPGITVYANQTLSARPVQQCPADDYAAACEYQERMAAEAEQADTLRAELDDREVSEGLYSHGLLEASYQRERHS